MEGQSRAGLMLEVGWRRLEGSLGDLDSWSKELDCLLGVWREFEGWWRMVWK